MSDEQPAGDAGERQKVRIFESYGRADASELASRLRHDLERRDFDVYQDIERLHGGAEWDRHIREALSNSEAVVAILSPHAVRSGPLSGDSLDSVCLDEIAFARFGEPPRPIVPVMAIACSPPLIIYRQHCIDMQGWESSEERYQAALEELVSAIHQAKEGRPPLRNFVRSLDPEDWLAGILEEKRRDFTGREWLFAEIERWREQTDERALLITGDPGAGKSAFAAELIHRNPGGQVVAYHCCIARLPDTLNPGKFVRNIAAMLASQLPAYAQAIDRGEVLELLTDAERDPHGAFEVGVIAPLAALTAPEGPARYILIDGLDEALAGAPGQGAITIPDLVSSRLQALPHWLRVVATSQRRRAVREKFKARELSLDAHDERNLTDVRDYLQRRCSAPALAGRLAGAGADQGEIVTRISALADGSFVYAKHAADALAEGNLDLDELERQPRGLGTLYEQSFARAFAAPGSYEPCALLLAVLLAALRGLTRAQLQDILGIADVELERRLAPLEAYLARTEGTYRVFHKSLADWLTDPSTGTTDFHVDRGAGERALLVWCRRWAAIEDDYPLRYLPSHLARCGEVDELLALLSDAEFERRRRAAGVTPLLQIEDVAALSALLLDADRVDDLTALAQTASPYRRDGVALALRGAGHSRDPVVRRTVERLLGLGAGRHGDDLAPELLSARIVAIQTAAYRGYPDALLAAAGDRSAAVRAVLVPHLYRYWKARGEEGWALLDGLGAQLPGRFGLPRQSQVEVSGGLSLAILTRDYDDPATLERLGGFWRANVRRLLTSPLVRTAASRLVLKGAVAALNVVMRDQPEYQPLNLRELRHTFSAPGSHERGLRALRALEEPSVGVGCVVEVLEERSLPFDVYLMMVAERALVLHGARDPAATLTAITHIYRDGAPWFRQSCLYSAFHTLNVEGAVEDAWLDTLGELTEDFFHADRARLQTAVAAYSFPPHLAWAEIVFERHRPTGKARFLNPFFAAAQARGDEELCRTVITACHLLSFAYRQPQIALDALRDIVPSVPPGSALQDALVEALANIRLYEDASVDRFLHGLGDHELERRVTASAATVRAEEFPTWMDSFVNHQLTSSDEFRLEMCGAFRRAAAVANVRELLYDNVRWVLNLLAGERLLPSGS